MISCFEAEMLQNLQSTGLVHDTGTHTIQLNTNEGTILFSLPFFFNSECLIVWNTTVIHLNLTKLFSLNTS